MSFSFRNLFNQEGEIPVDGAASANIKISNQTENPFSADRPSDPNSGERGNSAQPAAAAGNSLSFTVGELLAFIPPAISAQSGVSTTQMVSVPAPLNGANEIKLSTLYQVCPNLFAAEITPLNDSVIPLPSQAESAPAAETEPIKPSTENPFWSGNEAASPVSQQQAQPNPSASSDSFSGQGMNPPTMDGFTPASSADPVADQIQPGLGESLINRGQDQVTFQEAIPPKKAPVSPQQAPVAQQNVPASSQANETNGFISKENPFLSESDSTPESGVPNPFDSGPDFSTLFSKEAESEAKNSAKEPRDIPVKNSKGEISAFSAQVSSGKPSATPPQDQPSDAEASIFGKPSTSNTPLPESNEVEDADDLSAFIPPTAEELTMPDIPALRESEESAPQSETAKMEEYIFQGNPAAANPAASTGFVDAISEIPPLETTAPKAIAPETPLADIHSAGDFTSPAPADTLRGQPLEELEVSANISTPVPDTEKFPPIKDEVVRDIELRAVFGTNESFTLRKIATLIACMPGVNACAIATPGIALQASRDEEATIGEEAATLATTVRELAKLTGSPDAQSFTISTDKGILSIFVSGESYLTVQHDPGGFEPGVQEKLILVSRSLDGIEK